MNLPQLQSATLAIAIAAAVAPAPAQTQDELIRLRAAKLASPFLRQGGWVTDLATAQARARQSGKLILAYFTRSSATPPPCVQLEKRVLKTPEVVALGDKVVLFCHITSGVKGDKDQDLLRGLGGRGFPFFIGLDEAGRPVARFKHPQTLAGLQQFVDGDLAAYSRLRAAAIKGDKKAKAAFLMRRIELGHLRPAEIQKHLETVDYLDAAQRQTIKHGLTRLEILEILARIDGDDPASVDRAAKRMLVMKDKGRIPTGREGQMFWQIILGHADVNEKPKLFREALERIQKLPGAKPPKAWLKRMQHRLQALEWFAKNKQQGAPPRKRK